MSESHGIKGCSNHGCLVQPRPKGGMGTNALCKCLHDNRHAAERLVRWLRTELEAKDVRIAELTKVVMWLYENHIEMFVKTPYDSVIDGLYNRENNDE